LTPLLKEHAMSTVFVTGPTGVLGRATIPQLIASGHTVRALSRSDANDVAIRALGAEPVRGDLFDPASIRAAMTGADVVLHLATRIPPSSQMRRPEAWAENDRIRALGTKLLVDAAIETGVGTFVYPSFAFVYPDSGQDWIDASTSPPDPVPAVRSTIAAEAEVARFAASAADGSRRGIALRFGALYGPDVPSMVEQLDLAAKGISMFGANRNAYSPMLWIDDAASALVAALDGAPSGLYDVVDDEPITQAEFKSALAAAVGRRRLFAMPPWLIRALAGPTGAALNRSMRISNRRFRNAADWTPSVSNGRVGLARIAAERQTPGPLVVPRLVRIGLWLMALVTLFAGLRQQFAPRAFYDTFPGFGLQWVSVDGPYNEHLLRDLGGANLALALVILFAIFRPSVGLVRAVAGAMLVAQVPHFVYHAAHLDLLPSVLDRALQTTLLALVIIVPLAVFLAAGRIAPARPRTSTPIAPNEPAIGTGAPRLVVSTHS
jgi:nucleoside-diphosphate-sugar epimerase